MYSTSDPALFAPSAADFKSLAVFQAFLGLAFSTRVCAMGLPSPWVSSAHAHSTYGVERLKDGLTQLGALSRPQARYGQAHTASQSAEGP